MSTSTPARLLPLALLLAWGCKGDPDDTGEHSDSWDLVTPVFGAPNVDDDDGNGKADWKDELPTDEDDLASFVIPGRLLGEVAWGRTLELSLEGDVDWIRVWHGDEVVLDADQLSWVVPPAGADLVLGVEFAELLTRGSLTLVQRDSSGAVLRSLTVDAIGSPLVTNHHLQPVEELFVVQANFGGGANNAAMIDDLEEILGEDNVWVIPGNAYQYDVWIQDELEFAHLRGPDTSGEVVIDSIRNRGLDDFPEEELVGPGVTAMTWGYPRSASSLDSFGNLETTPPVTVDGVHYPMGRLYHGGGGNAHISPQLAEVLDDQLVQEPLEIDSTWLCVGHVDEFISFVPDPGSAKGFKMLVADTELGLELIQQLASADPDMTIPRYRVAHGYNTIGAMASDAALAALNDDIQVDEIEPVITQMKAELGLTDDDIIRVPSLFEHNQYCGSWVAALVPGMVNLAVAQIGEGPIHLLIPDPFLRSNVNDQSSDAMIAAWDALMPEGLETWYLDDWYVYHEGVGEIHCGTNTRRTPIDDWWSTSTHLFGGSAR